MTNGSSARRDGSSTTLIVVVVCLFLVAVLGVLIFFAVQLFTPDSSDAGGAGSSEAGGAGSSDASEGYSGELDAVAAALERVPGVEVEFSDTDGSCYLWAWGPEDVSTQSWVDLALALHTATADVSGDCSFTLSGGDRDDEYSLFGNADELRVYSEADIEAVARAVQAGTLSTLLSIDYDTHTPAPSFNRELSFDADISQGDFLRRVATDARQLADEVDMPSAILTVRYSAPTDGYSLARDVSFTQGQLPEALHVFAMALGFGAALPTPATTVSADAISGYSWGYVHVDAYAEDGTYTEWDDLSAAEQESYLTVIDRWHDVLEAADISPILYGEFDFD